MTLKKNRQRKLERNLLLVSYALQHPDAYDADIGVLFGVNSRQRVHQIIRAAKTCLNCYHGTRTESGWQCACREVCDMVNCDCTDWHPAEANSEHD